MNNFILVLSNAINIRPLFPRAWCESNPLPREKWNRVVNKAPLAASTNRFISSDAPSDYLARMQKSKQVSKHSIDELLISHAIPVAELRTNHFEGFSRHRASALLGLIEEAMGKAVSGRDSEEIIRAFGGAL